MRHAAIFFLLLGSGCLGGPCTALEIGVTGGHGAPQGNGAARMRSRIGPQGPEGGPAQCSASCTVTSGASDLRSAAKQVHVPLTVAGTGQGSKLDKLALGRDYSSLA